MPIVHFTSRREDVPEGAQNVRETDAYARDGAGTLWLYETHAGLCLEERERNGYHDSDFDMVVWNPETQAPETITFASTRGWSYPSYGSKADATPEVRAAYTEYQRAQRERREREYAEWLATQPVVGARVRVTGGRKLPKGTEAVVRWESRRPVLWSFSLQAPRRIGLKVDGSTERGYVFVSESQVEVLNG